VSVFHLLYLSTGSGHRIAARGIAEALQRANPDAALDMYDPIERLVPFFPRLENLGLGLTMRWGGSQYDARWRNGGSKLIDWLPRLPVLLRGLGGGKGQAVDAVIATHVFPLRMALAARARGLKNIRRIYGVVTDFGLHGYWPIAGVDGYFVAHEELRDEMVRRNFPAKQVYASGIPLREDFLAREEWQAVRIGGPLRVVVLAGGVQSGGYTLTTDWFRQMLDALQLNAEEARFTIVTGGREKLRLELEGQAKTSRYEVYPRGLVMDMAGLMRSHDLLIGKPGGLTVAEALSSGLPMGAMRPGPGPETANVAFLSRHGQLAEAYTPQQAAEVIRRAVHDQDWLFSKRREALILGRADASLTLANIVMEETGE
jgi:processive 1,2-diacylglycerol beta-glucosyltransferase